AGAVLNDHGGDGDSGPLGDADDFERIRVGQQKQKLVSADAADIVDAANTSAKPMGDLFQSDVADSVPQRVVDALEVVDIDEHHQRLVALALDALDLAGQRLLQAAAIQKLRQRIE